MIGSSDFAASLRYDDRGLLPAVVQDVTSGALLMLAYANREAVELTQTTREAHFFSRSRQEMWRKGGSSGNVIAVHDILVDCDRDALIYRGSPSGPACHLGSRSCFEPNPAELELGWLHNVLVDRRGAPADSSYTARLLQAGTDRVARKVVEEAGELVIAAVRHDEAAEASLTTPEGASARSVRRAEVVSEAADVLYHLLVLLESQEIGAGEVAAELARRHSLEKTPETVKPEGPSS